MKLTQIAAAAALSTVMATGVANASTISISTFDIATYNNQTAATSFVIEDFEAVGAATGAGELAGPLSTSVGTFQSLGGTGSGGTCDGNSGGAGGCTQVALEAGNNLFDQGNLVPSGGNWSLNSNDTDGISWMVSTGSLFNRIVFAIRDAADRPGIVLSITDGVSTASIGPGEVSGDGKLVVVDFDTKISSASIFLENSASNPIDSFTIDGAAVGLVPLPAAGMMLIGALGALGAAGRRRKKA